MPKLTKKDTKIWTEIQDLLNSTALTDDQIQFVFANYRPDMSVNSSKVSACFTPQSIAQEFSVACDYDEDSVVVDLAAGIGSLSYGMVNYGKKSKRVVAVEFVKEFYDIGRKLLPEVEWILGDFYDADTFKKVQKAVGGRADWVISNPPFGIRKNSQWLKYRGPSEMEAVEIAMLLAPDGMFIMPSNRVPYQWGGPHGHPYRKLDAGQMHRDLRNFVALRPEIQFTCPSIDLWIYNEDWKDGISDVQLVHLYCETPS
jgi:23S rRNA U2552 (ribose-2'-O)-methylase RlmE/FtsJ